MSETVIVLSDDEDDFGASHLDESALQILSQLYFGSTENGDCDQDENLTIIPALTSPSNSTGYVELDQASIPGLPVLRKNRCVELKSSAILPQWINASLGGPPFATTRFFLRTTKFLISDGSEVRVQGKLFARLVDFRGLFPAKKNELCQMIVHYDDTTDEDALNGIIEVNESDILTIRRLALTNDHFPRHSFKDTYEYQNGRFRDLDQEILVCRWKKVVKLASRRQNGMPFESEMSLTKLTELEADRIFSSKDSSLRLEFRGESSLGGAGAQPTIQESTRDRFNSRIEKVSTRGTRSRPITIEDNRSQTPQHIHPNGTSSFTNRRYTFGDMFCGAGGTSRGAKLSGLQIDFGVDKDHNALATYKCNFPWAECHKTDVHNWITGNGLAKVDILHLSPPCQPFSPAHTVNSVFDDQNRFAMLAIQGAIKRCLPRIITLEETTGLSSRHIVWFHSLLCQLTTSNFSVRSRVVRCSHYGVPQMRTRLLIIASCPGELLPEFPAPTHGTGVDCKPLIYPLDAIETIPVTFPNHDILAAAFANPKRSWDGRTRMARTITCSGGEGNYHPSGLRKYTHREFACLQTFPLYHAFPTKGVKKQIGNAVPPALAKAVYDEIINTLKRSDGIISDN